MEPWYLVALSFCIVVVPAIVVLKLVSNEGKLKRYWDVTIDMPEQEMLSIMGGGYSRSLLKNNRVKYEWRINAVSFGRSYNGFNIRSYSGVKKVAIYVKDGYVEEIKPYNI